MKLSSIKFYEGNNIKRKKRIVKITLGSVTDIEIKKYLKNYFRICFMVGYEEKVIDIEMEDDGFTLWVTYTYEELTRYILKNLVYVEECDIEAIAQSASKLIKQGFVMDIVKEVYKTEIPIIELTDDMFQFGYGKHSVIVGERYQSYEKAEKVEQTRNKRILWQQFSFHHVPKVDGKILYSQNEIEEMHYDENCTINIKSIDNDPSISLTLEGEKEFPRIIENMLKMYGRVLVYTGRTDYRIICFQGKAGIIFKYDSSGDKCRKIELEEKFNDIADAVYKIINIEFMYVDIQENNGLKVADAGCVFDIGDLLMENEHDVIEYFIASLRKKEIGLIPIVSITGTNGKTTTARLIHYMLNKLNYVAGLTSTGGVFIGNRKLRNGDTTGFLSAREVLMNNEVDAAVFETARGGIGRNGLGYEMAKAGIITSLSEDHIGMEGIRNLKDLAEIKSVILDELDMHGKIIIKAQKELINIVFDHNRACSRLNEECEKLKSGFSNSGSEREKRSANVSLFSISMNEYIEEYIENGGEAFYLEGENIIYCRDGVERKLLNVSRLPFTHYGYSKSNILNIMAAVSAVYSIYPNLEKIIKTLEGLRCDLRFNPGRQNIIEIKDFKVILDYGHNSEAFNEVFGIAKSLKPARVTSIIAAPGDRMDKYIEELGSIAANYSDFIIIREQHDLRGRKQGESAGLIKSGILNSGFPEENVMTILKEEDAIVYAMEHAITGEMIVLFTQCLDVIIPAINNFLKKRGMDLIEM